MSKPVLDIGLRHFIEGHFYRFYSNPRVTLNKTNPKTRFLDFIG
jgi:hypothetical protein